MAIANAPALSNPIVNSSHPLASRLIAAIVPSGSAVREIVQGTQATQHGSSEVGQDANGPYMTVGYNALEGTADSNTYLTLPMQEAYKAPRLAIVMVVKPIDEPTGAWARLLQVGSTYPAIRRQNLTSSLAAAVNSQGERVGPSKAFVVEQYASYAFLFKDKAYASIDSDTEMTAGANIPENLSNYGENTIYLGNDPTSGRIWPVKIYGVFMFGFEAGDAIVTPESLLAFSQNPWEILQNGAPSLSGRLVLDANGTPYVGDVTADIYQYNGTPLGSVNLTTDAQGNFSISHPSLSPSTPYRVGFRVGAHPWSRSKYALLTTSA